MQHMGTAAAADTPAAGRSQVRAPPEHHVQLGSKESAAEERQVGSSAHASQYGCCTAAGAAQGTCCAAAAAAAAAAQCGIHLNRFLTRMRSPGNAARGSTSCTPARPGQDEQKESMCKVMLRAWQCALSKCLLNALLSKLQEKSHPPLSSILLHNAPGVPGTVDAFPSLNMGCRNSSTSVPVQTKAHVQPPKRNSSCVSGPVSTTPHTKLPRDKAAA